MVATVARVPDNALCDVIFEFLPLRERMGVSSMSKVIAGLALVAAASVACRSTGAELLTNPDLDFPNAPPGWTLLEIGGTPPTPREAAKQQDFANQEDGGTLGLWLEAFQGQFFGNMAEAVTAVLSQTVPGVPGENYTFSGYSFFDPNYSGGVEILDPTGPRGAVPSPTQSTFELAFLNAGGNVSGLPQRSTCARRSRTARAGHSIRSTASPRQRRRASA
jgi:hypothetical protein